MKEAVARKMFSDYVSVQSFTQLQELGQKGGCIFGSNWTTKMFSPDRCGQVQPEGTVEGGHEYGVVGFDFDRKLVWLQNSWGNDWGVKLGKKGGYFNLTFGDFIKLWNDGGESECPIVP
jgi:C1A family cysteine protease